MEAGGPIEAGFGRIQFCRIGSLSALFSTQLPLVAKLRSAVEVAALRGVHGIALQTHGAVPAIFVVDRHHAVRLVLRNLAALAACGGELSGGQGVERFDVSALAGRADLRPARHRDDVAGRAELRAVRALLADDDGWGHNSTSARQSEWGYPVTYTLA